MSRELSRSRRPAWIFDFGNVVAHFDYAIACERLGRPFGLPGSELLRRARQAGLDPIVKRYEAGRMDARDFSHAVCGLVGLGAVGHDAFAAAWADIFSLNEPVARLVARLAASGDTLVLGSNTNDLHAAHFRRQFAEALGHFDRLVLSYEVGHVKPSPEFYLACAEAAGRPPGECVFIDDLPENVEGARAAGLLGVVYDHRRHDELLRRLAELGADLGAAP
jgi:putative hydrolase of the HAD superfamily